MKKHLLLLTAALLLTQPLYSQTKRIMHRSHSGKDQSQKKDVAEDNFGLNYTHMEREHARRRSDSIASRKRTDSLKRAGWQQKDSVKAKQHAPSRKKA